jgi:hypothetical protein
MKEKYKEERTKQGEISVAPSTWTPWYEIFDNTFGSSFKIKGVPNGVNQKVL